MPSPRSNHRKGTVAGGEKNRKGRLSEKAQSFHAGSGSTSAGKGAEMLLLQRPRTVPDLLSGDKVVKRTSSNEEVVRPQALKLTKLLLKVTIQRSLGAVQVVMSPESTVEDLIAAALRLYSKEGRRPVLASSEPAGFDLHYSQFSLESLNREERLMALGSRNFFLCPKKSGSAENCGAVTTSSSSCSKQAEQATSKLGLPWLKFMEFML